VVVVVMVHKTVPPIKGLGFPSGLLVRFVYEMPDDVTRNCNCCSIVDLILVCALRWFSSFVTVVVVSLALGACLHVIASLAFG